MARRFALQPVNEDLLHYGVKGMKWGVRRDRSGASSGPQDVSVKQKPGGYVKTSGGGGQSASADAIEARIYKQKAARSTTDSLSNKELQALVSRLNLEKQYDSLQFEPHRQSVVKRFILNALSDDTIRNLALSKGLSQIPAGKVSEKALKRVALGSKFVGMAARKINPDLKGPSGEKKLKEMANRAKEKK